MDINFFEPIKKNKKQSNIVMAIVFGIIIAAALAIVLFSVIEIMDQKNAQQRLDEVNAQLESEDIVKSKEELSKLEHSIGSMVEKRASVDVFDLYKSALSAGTTEMLSYIQSEITANSLLTKLTISGNTIRINAKSSTLTAMAQFSYNIANCGHFQNVLLEAETVELSEDGNSVEYFYMINAVIVGRPSIEDLNSMVEEGNENKDDESSEEVVESEEN